MLSLFLDGIHNSIVECNFEIIIKLSTLLRQTIYFNLSQLIIYKFANSNTYQLFHFLSLLSHNFWLIQAQFVSINHHHLAPEFVF